MSLRHVILSVLMDGPASGYDIARRFEQADRYFWNASHQQIYRDLRSLEVSGMVSSETVKQEQRPDRKVYRIDLAGREALDLWTREPNAPRINSEFLVKLNAAAAFGPDRVRRLLKDQRAIHAARLQTYAAIEREIDLDAPHEPVALPDLTRFLALLRGLRGERDWIEWIDDALIRLDAAMPGDAAGPSAGGRDFGHRP